MSTNTKRSDNRELGAVRPITIEKNYIKHPAGSVLISFGDTKVLCTASIEEKVPSFMRDSGEGWITAEYGMLPASTNTRMSREAKRGKQSGRTSEIQRLIGRALRSAVDLGKLGERTIHIDADVIQADGGTRTAAITGGMIALKAAIQTLRNKGLLSEDPIKEYIAAISVGVVNGQVMCDLCYEEDSNADVDMNVVMTQSGKYVEIQGTSEKDLFDESQLSEMLASAKKAIFEIITLIKS